MQQQQLGGGLFDCLAGVRQIILVLSGKGGVGKSTVACQLAMALAKGGDRCKVGILDVDICGPSVPIICGVEHKPVTTAANGRWLPVTAIDDTGSGGGSLVVMSIGFLLPSTNDAVVWRGPRKDSMIKQFLTNVEWGSLDYLIVDTPPGTSDEHLTLCEALRGADPTGAVVVTTPQNVSTDDVKKELNFCYKLQLRCLGVVENMSGFVCPHCSHCTDIFSKGGGEALARQYEVPFLGALPIDPLLALAEENGECFTYPPPEEGGAEEEGQQQAAGKSPAVAAILQMVAKVKEQVARVDQWRIEEKEEQQ